MELPLNFMGEDFIAEIDYTVTHRGCAAQTYGPPENCYPAEGPEWDVDSIVLWRDTSEGFSGGFEATGELFNALSEHFSDQISEAINSAESYDGDYYDD